jgi:hypothetical protein
VKTGLEEIDGNTTPFEIESATLGFGLALLALANFQE